ncbi:hypothetical protein Leryth_006915 [Lithospermum erythrorhizon]|nr:hypothetical protein Leryth_006915 [Lithospermum erythrorhizon]
MGGATASLSLLIPVKLFPKKYNLPSKFQTKRQPSKPNPRISICCRNGSQESSNSQQQLNLSVLRFTLGIPGLDESYLPRWIGYGLGSLLLLNHFVGTDSSTVSPAQLITEILGLSLAAFSVIVPYLGKFLKGATPVTDKYIPEGADQIFLLSQDISNALKEDLAWASYILLRSSNTTSVLIFVQDAVCIRGYWDFPKGMSKSQAIEWFSLKIQQTGLSNVEDTLYFPQAADTGIKEIIPNSTCSILVQPIVRSSKHSSDVKNRDIGLLLVASTSNYAYSEKDRAWIGAVANKFTDIQLG